MPWTGESFHKHNLGLSPRQSAHAAAIANHVLASTGNEGESIATANKLIRRDDGGMVPPSPGLAPTAANQQPNIQGIIQRFSGMAPEQLQELIPRLPAQMAQLAQRVLQQKRMMPQQQGQQQQAAPAMPQFGVPAQPQPVPQAAPVAPIQPQSQPAQAQQAKGGMVAWPQPKWSHGLPVGQSRFASGGGMAPDGYAHGGMQPRETVPILAAGGEFVVAPHHVARLGNGDIKEGHKWLDKFVVNARKHIVDTMKSLKPPVKS